MPQRVSKAIIQREVDQMFEEHGSLQNVCEALLGEIAPHTPSFLAQQSQRIDREKRETEETKRREKKQKQKEQEILSELVEQQKADAKGDTSTPVIVEIAANACPNCAVDSNGEQPAHKKNLPLVKDLTKGSDTTQKKQNGEESDPTDDGERQDSDGENEAGELEDEYEEEFES